MALAASKAYKKLGAEKQWDDSYVLYKKSNKSSRSADCGRDDSGRFGAGNDCASEDGSAESSQPAPADFRTESDKSRPSSTVSTPNGNIEVVDRSDIGTPDYLDEIECSGSKCGLSVTFEDAKKLQPSSGIDPSWSPIDAYIGKGYGYFTGNSQVGGESIDFHGKKYGTIDDFRANELKAEMLKKAEAEWDSMSDEQKAKEASVSVEFWKSGTQGDRDAYKKAWLGRKEHEEIWGKIDDLRSAARDKAVKQMREEPEKAVARETLDCCLQLYRGINIDDVDAEEILRNGRIAHSSANSWTTSRGTARSFGGNRLLLVLRKPRVGYVFAPNTHSEAEVVRPPSSMKIVGAARTKTGMVLYVEEDEDY